MKKQIYMNQKHELAPIFNNESTILILGSFPSVLSREKHFYYGNPQNRFWKVIAIIFDHDEFKNDEEKTNFLIEHHIALWDVIASCDIKGSSDSTITNVIPNDLSVILNNARIQKIFVNGKKAYELYNQYLYPLYHIEAYLLPSTSPINVRFDISKLCQAWIVIK